MRGKQRAGCKKEMNWHRDKKLKQERCRGGAALRQVASRVKENRRGKDPANWVFILWGLQRRFVCDCKQAQLTSSLALVCKYIFSFSFIHEATCNLHFQLIWAVRRKSRGWKWGTLRWLELWQLTDRMRHRCRQETSLFKNQKWQRFCRHAMGMFLWKIVKERRTARR